MIPILADVVWPALFLEERLFSWWAVGLGLAVEVFFVRWLTALSWRTSLLANLLMNAVSALLGIILIPLAGIAWEVFPGSFLYFIFDIGTFNPGTWAATFLFAVLINAGLEWLVLRFAFRQKSGKRLFLWLCVANSLTVALAFGSLIVQPPKS